MCRALVASAAISGWLAGTRASGALVSWGYDTSGQTNVPAGLTNVTRIGAGSYYSAVLSGGTVNAWGDGIFGETNVPVGLSNVAAVGCAGFHVLALMSNGLVTAWGYNNYGETNVPAGLSNVTAVAGGADFSLALQSNGLVTAWGQNSDGQANVPAGLSNVVAIAAGQNHSLALKQDGTVAAWGLNTSGQTIVPFGLSNVVAVAGGAYHTLALKQDGTMVAWGSDPYGELDFPPGLSNVVAIGAQALGGAALRSDGTLVMWGYDSDGETNVPPGLTNVVAMAAGWYHILVQTGDGSPTIVRQPWNVTMPATGTAGFSAGVVGNPPMSLQWTFNNTNIDGATNSFLNISDVQAANAGTYSLVASNAAGVSISAGALLTVQPQLPIVTLSPVSQKRFVGTDIALTSLAIGSEPLSYQWTVGGAPIAGATGTSLALTNAQVTNSGNYSLVITNAYGAVTSAVAVIVITPQPLDGVWLNANGGSWTTGSNWSGGVAASGYNATADFSTLDLTGDATVTLDSQPTVGNLVFSDVTPDHNWMIAPGTGGPLTLEAVTGSTSTITVSNGTTTIGVPIAGDSGLIKAGPGTLILAATNIYTGGTTVGGGTLQVGAGGTNGSLGAGDVINNGALIFNRSDNFTVSNNITGPGPTISHVGPGVLTLGGSNSFGATLLVTQGMLRAGAASALGTNGTAMLSNGATLDVNGFNCGTAVVTVSGSGQGGKGAIYNSGAAQTSALESVTLAGDTTFGGTGPWNDGANPGRWDIRTSLPFLALHGALSTASHPYQLTKTGSNQVSLVSIHVDPALGNIDIQQGKLGFEELTTSMGNPASNLTVRAGATLSFYTSTNQWNKVFILNGDGTTATVTNANGANTMTGPATLNGSCVFAVNGTSLTVKGPMGGTGGLTKTMDGMLNLFATNTYTGPTVVARGTLALKTTGSITNCPKITVLAGATLDVTGRTDGTLTILSNQVLQGNGTISGTVNLLAGALLTPGSNAIGVLTLNGFPNFSGTLQLKLNKAAGTNDQLATSFVLGPATKLVITNLGGTLVPGDTFKIFSKGMGVSTTTRILPLTPGPGLAWDLGNLPFGTLRVRASSNPVINSLTRSGASLVLRGTNGTAGGPAVMVMSTNAALPLWQWTPVATNLFDGLGHFGFTNAINVSTPQMYFAILDPSLTPPVARPVPGINAVQLTGTNLVVRGTNGAANAAFYVLTSTNVALPLSNWTRLSTNTCDGFGNFVFTNRITAGSQQQFFKMKLP